jgi:murein DD-endopeptidase MepM/ murein hydrolase activator NlpD
LGSPVLATASGTIFRIGDEPEGYGNFVQLWHDGLGTVYAHLSQVSVSLNQAVAKGEEVGKCGNTGNAKGTTPHVHVEVRAKGANPRGEPVDPAQYGLA